MTFKDHFSGHAAVYREARPRYPDALFAWLADHAPTRALAWDAGCGNGQASVALADRFAHVLATDPSVEQIAHAEARSNIDYRVEPAEQCSLADASADLVCVGQALHWFDLVRFHAEVRRVLKRGGLIAEWTYADCRVTPAIDVFKDRLYVELTGPYWPAERALVENGYRTLAFPFTALPAPPFVMAMTWNVVQFVAYLRSWSASQRYLKVLGHDPVALIETDLRAAWGESGMLRTVRWDFSLRVGRID